MNIEQHMRSVVLRRELEAKTGTFGGRMTPFAERYLARCRYVDDTTATLLIFTRDVGHHSFGWLRNPDYERCWHLSLSRPPSRILIPGAQRAELDAKTRLAWVRAFFGEHMNLLWEEKAYSDQGRIAGVMHYRLFCDEAWTPILPRGEVYSSEFTEIGWRSGSQVLEEERLAKLIEDAEVAVRGAIEP